MRHTIFTEVISQLDSNQDDAIVCVKWLFATTVLTVPSFMPDLEQWIRLISVSMGSVTALLGLIIMTFKFIDLIKKRYAKKKGNE